jgi:hypothetical protein
MWERNAVELDRRVRRVAYDEQRRRVEAPSRQPPLQVGSQVLTPLGRATVLAIDGERLKVQYVGFTSWSWVARKDIKARR